jgi:aspartate aminotransferase
MKISSRIKNISPSLTLAVTAKARKMKAEGVDIIGFGSGEPDFDTPSHIKDAAIKSIQQGFTKYTPTSGIDELKRVICEKFSADNNLRYEPSDIVVSCGAKHSIYNIIQAACDKGDEVIIPSPYWLSYPEMVRMAEGAPVFIETSEKDNFKVSIRALKGFITKKTKIIIINSPSNPTGCVYNIDELKKIGELALEKNILLISDEIYEKIIFDNRKHVSVASISRGLYENTVVVNGVSKSYAMTGWRVGYLASPSKDLISAIKNLQDHSTSNPTSISQMAALEALKNKDRGIDEMVREFERRRDYIVERVNNTKGLSCIKPEGAFYVFCKLEKARLSSMEATERLLDEARVAVIPGKPFGSDRHIRLSFATSMENIKKGMDRMEKWFEHSA